MEKILTSYVDSGELERVASEAGVPAEELKATAGKYGGFSVRVGRRTLLTVMVVGLIVAGAGVAGAVYWQRRQQKRS